MDRALGEMMELQALLFQDNGELLEKLVGVDGLLKSIAEREGLRCSEESLAEALSASRASEASDDVASIYGVIANSDLASFGFAVVGVAVNPASDLPNSVARAITACVSAGLPPVFALAFDEVWLLLDEQMGWLERESVLGKNVGIVLEADVNCWRLRSAEDLAESGSRIGDSFGNPHRDLRHDQCHDADTDALTALSLWVPVNESGAGAENGAMRCVPIDSDDFFYSPDHPSHMTTDAAHARAEATVLAAPKGHACIWQPSLIHFGGACQPGSRQEPRVSVAATFRSNLAPRCAFNGNGGSGASCEASEPLVSEQAIGPGPLARADLLKLGLDKRLSYAAKAVLAYSHWTPGLPGCELVNVKR
jgi:hypothetical protein